MFVLMYLCERSQISIGIRNPSHLYSSTTTQVNEHCAYPSFILTHAKGIPFGRKNGFGERRGVCVSLCALFNALHAHGWRAASKCNLDTRKRRSVLLFTFSPQQPPSDSEYACATVNSDRETLLHVIPLWVESDVKRQGPNSIERRLI